MNRLTDFDLTPFYRNAIGIDRIMDSLLTQSNGGNYPPYNILSNGEDKYIIEIAVAGFAEDDINVTAHDGKLVIKGEMKEKEGRDYLHHGISNRKFKRTFELADYVEVQNANLVNGILRIDLERIVPENLRPKEIKVNAQPALES